MLYKSQLKSPETGSDYVFIVDAAYGPGNRPVCGICWSQLDYTWGKADPENDLMKARSGKGEDYVDKDGESWLVWQDVYKCSNPECDGAAFVRSIPAKLTFDIPWHPDDIKQHSIQDPLFDQGFYDENGVFWLEEDGEFYHVEAGQSARDIGVDYQDPWVYIDPGVFAEEIPPAWTMDDQGRIKTNVKTQRFKQIQKWFALRQIRIEDPRD